MDIFTQIGFNLNAFLINILGFLLLLWILSQTLFKNVGGLLEQRQQEVKAAYDKIEADQKQMQALKAEYEQRLAAIEAEAREKIQAAIHEAQAARDQIIAEANTRARDMITRAEREVEYERQQALIALREQVVDLALAATTKVIGENLSDDRQRRLITDFIAAGTTTNGSNAGKLPSSDNLPGRGASIYSVPSGNVPTGV